MKKENSRKDLLESVRQYIQQSEEKQRIQLITDALGERRDRDLQDILSLIEQEQGCKEIINYLSKVQDFHYSLPIGVGPPKSVVEEMKLREAIFSLLSCCGLEPVTLTTGDLLDYLKNEESLVDASSKARNYIESLVIKQIQSGDTLFFDTSIFDSHISSSLVKTIEQTQQEQVNPISITQYDNEYDIHPLWYTEIGRQALSTIGIKGSRIETEQLDTVLSVIQMPLSVVKEKPLKETQFTEPSNKSYADLLISMISHDVAHLCDLGSKLSYPTIKTILEEALDHYLHEPTSEKYRNVLTGINAHIRIRTIDSIGFLEHLAQSDNLRIATTAITALGNFYHESSASALVDLLCKTKNQDIIMTTTSAILNVSKRCAETGFVILGAIESNSCTQKRHLKSLRKEIIEKRLKYSM